MSNKLAEMTTDEARDAVRTSPLMIIPVGAQEQHGGGMAMSTDIVRAEGLADLVAEQAGRPRRHRALGQLRRFPAPHGVRRHRDVVPGNLSVRTT